MISQNRMENKLKFLLLLLVCLFAVSAFSACGQGQNNAGSLNYPVLQLNVGESKELELTENDIIILQGVEWSSDDESVATVKNGLVTAVGAGSATINASYNGRIYACSVTVKAISVTALSNTELFLIIGEEKTLSLLKDGEQIRDGIEWSSSDEEVVTAENGNVLCLSAGVFECAAIKFKHCKENRFPIYTERVVKAFESACKDELMTFEFISEVVDAILINKSGGITVRFMNDAEVDVAEAKLCMSKRNRKE